MSLGRQIAAAPVLPGDLQRGEYRRRQPDLPSAEPPTDSRGRGTNPIDLLHQCRVAAKTPAEEPIGEIAELVLQGTLARVGLMSERDLPAKDDHELVDRGGHPAVSVPLEEYEALKLPHGWLHSPDRVRTSPEDFLAVSGLDSEDQQILRQRYGLSDPPR